jgi:hypothetical protein
MMDTIFQAQIAEGWLKVYMDNLLICNNGNKADMTEKILIVLQLLKEHVSQAREMFILRD